MSHTDIGTRVRTLRYEAGFTLKSVASTLGVTESYVMQIEHGTKQLSVMNAKKLADLFGCKIEDFLEASENA